MEGARRHFVIAALGRDRPGIVAGLSRVLLDHGLNLEDSRMTVLAGRFAVLLAVSGPPETRAGALARDLDVARAGLGLDRVSLDEVSPPSEPPAVASHVVSIYGADHPGIVHAVSQALAGIGASISDLETRLAGAGQPLYLMLMEVALPPGGDGAVLERVLVEVGRAQGLDVSVRPIERDPL